MQVKTFSKLFMLNQLSFAPAVALFLHPHEPALLLAAENGKRHCVEWRHENDMGIYYILLKKK